MLIVIFHLLISDKNNFYDFSKNDKERYKACNKKQSNHKNRSEVDTITYSL